MVFAGCIGGTGTTTTQTTIRETQATSMPTTTSNAGAATDMAQIHASVTDRDTKMPIPDALVFIGNGYKDCRTDESGSCAIADFAWGSYSLNVFKKGYTHFTNSSYFERGDNWLPIEIEKQPDAPESFAVSGTVIVIVAAKGTKSENHYLKLKNEGGEHYLFDKYGLNRGAEGHVGKMVRVVGYNGTGSIGWQSQKTSGIYVEEIKPL